MKYLLLDYRGGLTPVVDLPPMDQWTPQEIDAHPQYMDFAACWQAGEYVDGRALAPEGRSCGTTARGAHR